MMKLALASIAAAVLATGAQAQTAPKLDPYVGVTGGWEQFDRDAGHGIPETPINADHLNGGLVEGVAGVNVPVGRFFVGAEGQVAKGFVGDIDWEYGAAGRFGVRAGDSGLFYGKVGYRWVNFDKFGDDSRDYGAMQYGIGAEVSPSTLGVMGHPGVRMRLEVSTFGGADSFRPMAGVIAHF